jgi:hypothetical protein
MQNGFWISSTFKKQWILSIESYPFSLFYYLLFSSLGFHLLQFIGAVKSALERHQPLSKRQIMQGVVQYAFFLSSVLYT